MSIKDSAVVQSFTGAKLVKNSLLNRMGLQVVRTYGARWLYNLRPSPVDPSIRLHLQQLRRDGMVVLENFLPNADFTALKKECLDILAKNESCLNTRMHGPTEYSIAPLNDFPEAKKDLIERFYADPRLYA